MVLSWLWLLVPSIATAGGPQNWSSAYDARLSQAMGSDPSEAIAIYEALIAQIAPDDEQRGDVLYWLGRARWSAGDLAGARRSLESAQRYRSVRARVRILLGRMDAEDKAVRQLPYRQEFRLTIEPWVRGWERGRASDLAVFDGPSGRTARWATEVIDDESDFILFGLETDGERVSGVSMRLRSESLQGRLRVLLEDKAGHRWTVPLVSISTDRWIDLVIPIDEFVSAETPAKRGSPNPAQLKWFILRDVTALHTDQQGPNALLIDDLVVR